MRIWKVLSATAFATVLGSVAAYAAIIVHLPNSKHIIQIFRPGTSANTIQVDAIERNCKVAGFDFYYLMDGDKDHEQRSMIEGAIKAQIPEITPRSLPKAGCEPGTEATCHAKYLRFPMLDVVNHGLSDPTFAVKARRFSDGSCITSAYMDNNGQTVQITSVIVKARRESLNIFAGSASVRVYSVQILGQGNFRSPEWVCRENCIVNMHL